MTLHIDLETYSSVNLIKYGMHKYCESPDFEILLFAYAFDDEPVTVLQTYDQNLLVDLPKRVQKTIHDPSVIKMAHNAPFEICCLRRVGFPLDEAQWRCTAVHAAQLGLPRSLGELSTVLRLPEDKSKKATGRALIRYFCIPRKPTKKNPSTRNLPQDDPQRWKDFMEYCGADVEAEREIDRRLSSLPVPEDEWEIWRLDQEINNRGALVDLDLVKNAMLIGSQMRETLESEAVLLTGLDNPNSVAQLKEWLETEMDEEIETLQKADVTRLIKATDDDTIERVLKIRQLLGKSSLSKYDALAGAACDDGRIRGTLLFYGASRTGRWAGRVFQPQNLPQNHLDNITSVREVVKHHNYDVLDLLYGDSTPTVADVLSQLIRTAIIPKDGHKFVVVDYSAVEARALAYLAGEEWRLDVFRGHGKIYEASASAAFNIPIEQIGPHSALRQQGKVLELACGYGGSVGAVEKMDHKKAIPPEDRKGIVAAWRKASPNIVKFWWDMGEAAINATENPGVTYKARSISFIREKGFLFMQLPSGRRLAYPRPMMKEGNFGMQLTFEGTDQYKKSWGRIDTYGPKLVENVTQAFCRDLLAYGMRKVRDAGYEIVLHVHDEAIIEAPMDTPVKTIEALLETLPPWAAGMPHRADGFETLFYMKED